MNKRGRGERVVLAVFGLDSMGHRFLRDGGVVAHGAVGGRRGPERDTFGRGVIGFLSFEEVKDAEDERNIPQTRGEEVQDVVRHLEINLFVC